MRTLAAIFVLCTFALAQTPAPKPPQQPAGAAANSPDFSSAVASDLLGQVAQGMQSRNSRQVLGAFDSARFSGYDAFSRQLGAYFRDNTSFRVYYKVQEATTEGGQGIAVVDFEFEATPAMEQDPPVRRHARTRFTFERGPKGWKITDFNPRSLFS